MEWYFASYFDDLAVPRDEETFSRFQSPDGWSSWGKRARCFNIPEKVCESGIEEFLYPDIALFGEELSAPHVDQDARHAYDQWDACLLEHSDPQLNDTALIDEADDIFFHSLFEDATELHGTESSSKFAITSSTDHVVSVDHSGEWNHMEDCTNNSANFGRPPTNQLEQCSIHRADEQFNPNEYDDTCKTTSAEESVLLDLQRLTFQLTKKTRRCFRDSLYRLAENSTHQTKCNQNRKESAKSCKPSSKGALYREQQSKANVQDTNAIDRTVATLLFNVPGSSLHQPATPSISNLPGQDAEVPTFGLTGQALPPSRGHQSISSTPY